MSRARLHLVAGACAAFIGCASSSGRQPEATRPLPASSSGSASVVPGELLVTFTEPAARAIEQARANGTLPRTGIASLDALFARYEVATIEPVFARAPSADTVRAKYPQRARRAPPDATLPDLSRAYRLTLKRDADVRQAAHLFSADPHVESAQPNALVTIQPAREARP